MLRQLFAVTAPLAVGFAVLGLPLASRSAEPARTSPLYSFDVIQKRLGSPKLRILDARPRIDYERGHIPGAVWVDSKAAERLAARPGGLTDRAAWEAWTAPLGLSPGMEVVIVDDSRQLDAARLWWLLGHLGVEKVGLVDGGVKLWHEQGRPWSAEPALPETRPFPVQFRDDRNASRADVLAALRSGGARIVDARTTGEYTGAERKSKRGGHIPSSCHLEWTDLVDKDGRFLDRAALRERLDRLGIRPGEPLVTHCQGGGRASVDAFALEQLGHPVRNYYPGWSDWGNVDDTPVETTKPAPKSP